MTSSHLSTAFGWEGAVQQRLDHLLGRAVARDRRIVLGLVGAPGAGKSTVSEFIAGRFGEACAVVAMDGFHLATPVLAGTDLASRRGAPDTFDARGFVEVLRRIRTRDENSVHVPTFDRQLEEPLNAAAVVRRETPLVVIEGNYLLQDGPWRPVRELLDEVWFVERSDERRLADLTARHHRHGKSAADALAWATGPDERNAQLVVTSAHRADRTLDLGAGELRGNPELVVAL